MALFHASPKDPADKALFDYIHNIFGFYPKNIALYRVAFTHKSVAAETVATITSATNAWNTLATPC